MILQIARGRGGMFLQHFWRADGPAHLFAFAVWTDIVERLFRTVRTERAFERTDARVRRIGREIFVATFAVRFKRQHG